MKTKKFLGCLAALAMSLHASAQVAWDTDGNTAAGLDWFGADASSIIPLRIRNDANQPIDWYTNAIQRLRLNPAVTTSINGLPAAVRDGFLLLSGTDDAFTDPMSNAPFTRLHLIDPVVNAGVPQVYAQEFGYRNWQRNGITITGNRDHAYIGHKYGTDDISDFIVQWSDKQRLRQPRPNAACLGWGT